VLGDEVLDLRFVESSSIDPDRLKNPRSKGWEVGTILGPRSL